jgi:hypothetical protein
MNVNKTPLVIECRTEKESLTLEQAQDIVGGYVQLFVPLHNRHLQVLVNEDGFAMKLPLNPEASRLCGCPIVGNAIVLAGEARWT